MNEIPLCCPVCGYLNIIDLGNNYRKRADCLDEWIEDREPRKKAMK